MTSPLRLSPGKSEAGCFDGGAHPNAELNLERNRGFGQAGIIAKPDPRHRVSDGLSNLKELLTPALLFLRFAKHGDGRPKEFGYPRTNRYEVDEPRTVYEA